MRSKTFQNETDFIQKLNHYTHVDHRLTSTTLFCTIKVVNYYTIESHKNMIDTVVAFLYDNTGTPVHNKMSLMTIRNLLELFHFNNIFCYKNNIYVMTKGSPTTMPLTSTVANIYLFECQKMLLNLPKQYDELFGR